MSTLGRLCAVAFACTSLAACASSKSDGDLDAGPADASVDAGPCEGVTCPGLTYCKEGQCVPYPACPVDGGMPGPDPVPMCGPGTVCRNGVCIPDGTDVDNDGHPASTDCDEQNPNVHPGAVELCNLVDDDCSMVVDDGDNAIMCSGASEGRVCENGTCVCPAGTFDLDTTVPGCECAAAPAIDQGTSCATAIDLGSFVDINQGMTLSGNIPNGREVWYRFRGVDAADTSCDNYHVRAALLTNPGDQFRIRMYRGTCGAAIGVGQFTTIEWYTDFRANVGGVLTGQCPCFGAGGTPVDNVSTCSDDSADYFAVVERVTGGTNTCASFGVELSNGRYDAQ